MEIKYCVQSRGCGKSQRQIKELVENLKQGNKVVFARKDMMVDLLNYEPTNKDDLPDTLVYGMQTLGLWRYNDD